MHLLRITLELQSDKNVARNMSFEARTPFSSQELTDYDVKAHASRQRVD